jgi:hypothetical protein
MHDRNGGGGNYRNLSNTTYGKKIISILKNARFSGKGRQSFHI